MESLRITDVRCFRDASPRIRPLTILVGENSTGKSTLLALLRVAWDLANGQIEIDFNEDPFRLGAYDQIAHYHGGQGKRAREFSIAATYSPGLARGKKSSAKVSVRGIFQEQAGQPRIAAWQVDHSDTSIRCTLGLPGTETTVQGTFHGKKVDISAGEFPLIGPRDLWDRLRMWLMVEAQGDKRPDKQTEASIMQIWQDIEGLRVRVERPMASAPIRTGPQRTYDPVRETPQPAGGHVPMLLSRLAATDPEQWELLGRALAGFGSACGLFRNVSVHRARKGKVSEPFQIMVEIEGQRAPSNLVDVGYGVSQVLPVLVDAVLQPRAWFALQQPEVHLHPRAQAELGSFLGTMVKSGRRFAVETHSDFLVDRVCTEVRRGNLLEPNDVIILFFERIGSSIQIHEIEISENGDLTGAPATYREFFRREQGLFLGIEE